MECLLILPVTRYAMSLLAVMIMESAYKVLLFAQMGIIRKEMSVYSARETVATVLVKTTVLRVCKLVINCCMMVNAMKLVQVELLKMDLYVKTAILDVKSAKESNQLVLHVKMGNFCIIISA
mmetsp:Transcript_19302/g.3138  ORF Transcript_19302/g.3138 Transcript_19302/m.3138 type:complete len:122 (+) Transcript_19302:262-627(+)